MFEGIFENSINPEDDLAFESMATNLDRDFKDDDESPLSLKSMYRVYMNNDALDKYEEQYDQLKKVDRNVEKLRGCMYFWKNELAAFISTDLRSGKVWIETLEVVKKFRGKKLSHQLLDVAVRKFHATDLKVNKDNDKAISIFKTYGFKTYDKKNQWLYMTLRDDVKDIDDIHTDDVKPVERENHSAKVEEAKESFMGTIIATEGVFSGKSSETNVEELLASTEKHLRKKLRTIKDCDDYLKMIDQEAAQFNEASNAIISAGAKYEHSKKTPEDKKKYEETIKAGKKLLNQNCKSLKVKLGHLVGDNDEISRQDIKNFAQYTAGAKKIVKTIREELANDTSSKCNKAACESTAFDFTDVFTS